jgi:hypothetical protein
MASILSFFKDKTVFQRDEESRMNTQEDFIPITPPGSTPALTPRTPISPPAALETVPQRGGLDKAKKIVGNQTVITGIRILAQREMGGKPVILCADPSGFAIFRLGSHHPELQEIVDKKAVVDLHMEGGIFQDSWGAMDVYFVTGSTFDFSTYISTGFQKLNTHTLLQLSQNPKLNSCNIRCKIVKLAPRKSWANKNKNGFYQTAVIADQHGAFSRATRRTPPNYFVLHKVTEKEKVMNTKQIKQRCLVPPSPNSKAAHRSHLFQMLSLTSFPPRPRSSQSSGSATLPSSRGVLPATENFSLCI